MPNFRRRRIVQVLLCKHLPGIPFLIIFRLWPLCLFLERSFKPTTSLSIHKAIYLIYTILRLPHLEDHLVLERIRELEEKLMLYEL